MKNRIIALLLSIATLFAGCSKSDPAEPEVEPSFGTMYVGTMTVISDGTENISRDVEVEVTYLDAKSVSVLFHRVKFVPQMPVSLDVVVSGIKCEPEKDGSSTLSGDGIVPEALTMPYPAFTVTALSGKMDAGKLSLTLNFGNYPTSYSGTVKTASK